MDELKLIGLLIIALSGILDGCAHRSITVTPTEAGGYTVEGNVSTGRIVDIVYAQTTRTTFDGAIEHGVPARVHNAQSGTELSVGGDKPFMYGYGMYNLQSYGRNDRDQFAVATSEAAINAAIARGERPPPTNNDVSSELNALEGDVRALQTLVGSMHQE